jgi:iron complex transport system substrate-binding protein
MRRTRKIAALISTALLVAAACVKDRRTEGSVTIVDSLGRKVVVPEKVGRIISLEPEITRIIVALGAGDRLVGVDFFLRNYDHLFPLVFPEAARLPVISNQGQDLSYEQAVRLRPDIVFVSPSESQTAAAIERKLGVPVAALASMGSFRGLLDEMGTLGRILGKEERAASLKARFKDRLDALGRIVRPAPPEDRPLVYLAFWNSLIRTPVCYEPVDAAGGRNAASGIMPAFLGAAGATVSVEKLLVWNPEVILVQGNYPTAERQVTVETVLRDPRLASLRAVRSGRVHYTFGYWYWWDPALVLVETLYLARLLHPDELAAFDLAREGDALFEEFYGVEGAFSALCRVLACHEWTTR